MKKFLTALAASLMLVTTAAFAVPTAQQVERSMTQGNWQQADTQLSEVLQAHPQDPRAHYLYAQVLDREGRYADALSHLQQAKSIDPAVSFTDRSRFAATEARIQSDANRAALSNGIPGAKSGSVTSNPFNNQSAAPAPAPRPEKHGPSIGSFVGIAVLFVGIALVLRWGLRRARAKDDTRADDDRRAQLKRATELLNDVRTLKLDLRISSAPERDALLKQAETVETQLRELVEALSNAKNPVPPYTVEDLGKQVESLRARAEGRPDPNAAPAPGYGESAYAQEAERFGRGQSPYPPNGPYPPQPAPQQQPPVIIQQGGGGFGGGMGGLLTGVLLGEALSHGRDRVIEREVPAPDNRNNNDAGGGLDFGTGSNDWNDNSGGGLDLGNNDDNWRDT
jgi:hypothetical protein